MTNPKKLTALARARVSLSEDSAQDTAARYAIDYTGGGDTVAVYVNPELVPAEAREGYALRGAIMAALEGFRRYNRGQTRRHGTREDEQRQFDFAYDKALSEIEELIHLTPTVSAFAPAKADKPSNITQGETPIDYSFPHFRAVFPLGLSTVEAVNDAPDSLLLQSLTPPQVVQVRRATRRALGLPPLASPEPQEAAIPPEAQASPESAAPDPAPMTLSAPAVTAAAAPTQAPAPEAAEPAPAATRKRRGGPSAD